jgi:hypothetical protein
LMTVFIVRFLGLIICTFGMRFFDLFSVAFWHCFDWADAMGAAR